ncbi:Putative RutC-like superfamily protein [Colletotrichum destructivum]|uniref:RutC-like superfamily protein n=1 Tax=Colletotrichum destructivum TaxID=34406 RepID=A0AAX4I078_9PEZI|nr:Putative RutC-like superfamily protein [Colletotrichum destructivum]
MSFFRCQYSRVATQKTGALNANDSDKQVQLAIENVGIVLKAAGPRGWDDVYLLRSYHRDIRTSWEPTAEALKKRIPGHRPYQIYCPTKAA